MVRVSLPCNRSIPTGIVGYRDAPFPSIPIGIVGMQSVRAHGYDTTPKWPEILSYSYDGVKNLPEFFCDQCHMHSLPFQWE